MEDMRRQRLLLITFESLLGKLKEGRKEHEFVAALKDIISFCDLREHDVPGNARRLLTDARSLLRANKIRGKFWKSKAESAYRDTVAKLPAAMSLAAFTEEQQRSSKSVKTSKSDDDEDDDDEEEDEDDGADSSEDDVAESPKSKKSGVAATPAKGKAPAMAVVDAVGGDDDDSD